ncbi:excinuclease ABC subunit C [Iodidimonas gelatinilytica]|uniref:Excinuclease ABC subunit C n=1 Tax=Iodidimonas gelatinilytica TaxID=1236966 RepID=A0A5A7MTV6_9PROT|nr:GIY-YIG nuclease family protein [Iodidimonas gelatinilytica]GEQ99377.1 excinuclease ABC subunit C [Iodidimonas gelatinilytica]
MSAYVYILASQRNGTLYIGVTADIARRTHQHRMGKGGGFTQRYGISRLVWYEPCPSITDAIQREKTLKSWPRRWKLDLIEKANPQWDDLWEQLNA